MRYSLILGLLIMLIGCKNPFSNQNQEKSPVNYSIQNTENGEILLRLKPNVGDKTNLQMDINLQPQGMMISLDTHFVGDLKLRATDTNETENVYSVDFQRIQFNTSVLGTKISYDSQKPNNDLPQQLTQEIEQILAKKVVMSLDSLAQVNYIEFGQNKNDIATKSIDLNTLFIPLPADPVKVGSSWVAQQNVQNIGEAELTYTIERISDTEVLVKLTSTNVDVKGKYLINRKTGFTKNGELDIQTTENGKGLKMNVKLSSSEAL